MRGSLTCQSKVLSSIYSSKNAPPSLPKDASNFVNLVIDDNVEIFVKWAATKQLNRLGVPVGKWEVISREPGRLMKIPNNTAPFVIESTPEKGDRVRFGMVNTLYFDQVGKLTLEQVQADQASA